MKDLDVSPIIDHLLQYVASYLEGRYNLSSDVKEKLKKLKQALNRIQAVAYPTDDVEIMNKNLLDWRMDLMDAAQEAEDVLDEFEYQRLEEQVAAADEDDGGGQWRSARLNYFSPGKFFSLPNILKRFTQPHEPLKKLARILNRFEELATDTRDFLELVKSERSDWEQRKKGYDKRRETTSFMPDPELFGRTKELKQIIDMLVAVDEGSASTSRGDWEIPVVPIVGPGGFGKTTLARHVFHHRRVVEHFHARLWVHVSQNFDVKRLTREMIESVASERRCDDIENLDRLQRELKGAVGTKRFLLVLDDMWCGEDSSKQLHLTEEDWRRLFAPLAAGARGSMVLLTSRSRKVARLPGAFPPILLRGLVDDECWEMIKARAVNGNWNPADYQSLVAVGEMLHHNRDDGYWGRILDTGLGASPGVMEVLKLSYRQLPPHLRKCFAYCSLFPKGYRFYYPERLGCMWVAQGFIRPRPGETIEEAGMNCFIDLFTRSFFEHSEDHKYYMMHDLMNDLARNVSRGDCLGVEGGKPWEDNIPETVRHISVSIGHLAELSEKGCKFDNLRSLLLFKEDHNLDDKLVKDVLKQLRRIRVLYLGDCKLEELPEVVGECILLRYLDLSETSIKSLPESLCRLYHLQALIRPVIVDLPRKMSHLINLRILNIEHPDAISKIAFIGRLNALEALNGPFRVRKERGYGIGQLKGLNGLRGKLAIENLENVATRQEAEAANLCGKRLEELILGWDSTTDQSYDMEGKILQALRPHSDLKHLTIKEYWGETCPSWMCNEWLPKLNSMELVNLRQLKQVPPLGQLQYLKKLCLNYLNAVAQLGRHELYGSSNDRGFLSLKELTIDNMANLERWSGLDGGQWFPSLQELTIKKCPKLRMLPPLSPTITKMDINDVGLSALPGLYDCCDDAGMAHRGSSSSSSSSSSNSSSSSELSKLCIVGCPNLSSLSEGLLHNQHCLRHLKELVIKDCVQLVSPPTGGFRKLISLEILRIDNCPRLALPTQNQEDNGRRPFLRKRRKKYIKQEENGSPLPSSLQYLDACYAFGNEALQDLTNLVGLRIVRWPCLPPAELLCHLRMLKNLIIVDCEALTYSGLAGIQALVSLKELAIKGCPRLLKATSSPTPGDAPGMAFSSSLKRLLIDDLLLLTTVPILKTVSSLQDLSITLAFPGCSFPPEVAEWLLRNQTTLQKIKLFGTPSLESLPHNLQHLSSLKELVLYDAPQLQSLSGLPNSLEKLLIGHPHIELKRRCQSGVGHDWQKIQHIKKIQLSDQPSRPVFSEYQLITPSGIDILL